MAAEEWGTEPGWVQACVVFDDDVESVVQFYSSHGCEEFGPDLTVSEEEVAEIGMRFVRIPDGEFGGAIAVRKMSVGTASLDAVDQICCPVGIWWW